MVIVRDLVTVIATLPHDISVPLRIENGRFSEVYLDRVTMQVLERSYGMITRWPVMIVVGSPNLLLPVLGYDREAMVSLDEVQDEAAIPVAARILMMVIVLEEAHQSWPQPLCVVDGKRDLSVHSQADEVLRVIIEVLVRGPIDMLPATSPDFFLIETEAFTIILLAELPWCCCVMFLTIHAAQVDANVPTRSA